MVAWEKWLWPGLIVTLILTVIAARITAPFVEKELTAKANASLTQNNLNWADVSLDGRDLTLRGTATEQDAANFAIALSQNAYDVRVVNNLSQLLEIKTPYSFSATLKDRGLTLNGFVPNESYKSQLLAAAKSSLPKAKITDNLKLARGDPENYLSAAKFGMSQLVRMNNGKVNLNATSYSIEGVALTSDDYSSAIRDVTTGLPQNFKLANKNIIAPHTAPYTWSAKLTGKQLFLKGFIPDIATRNAVLALAGKANPGKTIVDQMNYASGAPKGFPDVTGFGLSLFKNFSSGNFELQNTNLSVVARANTLSGYDQTIDTIKKDILPGYKMVKQDISHAIAKPYIWSAYLANDAITLTGFAPSSTTSAEIEVAAIQANSDKKIINKLMIADGAPADFIKAIKFAFSLFPSLSTGKVVMTDSNFDISGAAKTNAAYKTVISQMDKEVTPSYLVTQRQIVRPQISPYVWSASKTTNSVILDGYAPSAADISKIVKNASQMNSGLKIISNLEIALGAPKNYASSTRFTQNMFAKLLSGKAKYNDGKLMISGQAASVQYYVDALSLPASAGMTLTSRNIKPARVQPYKLRISKTSNNYSMVGYVPNETARNQIRAAIKKSNPAANIIGKTWIATGVPAKVDWSAGAKYGVNQLKRLSTGSVRLSNRNFHIKGVASTLESYHGVKATLAKGVAGAMKLASQDINPPRKSPYVWNVARNGKNVILDGFIPEMALAASNTDAINANFGQNLNLQNKLALASGAPSEFAQVTNMAIKMIGGLANSRATLINKRLTISGEALSEVEADQIKTKIASALPDGYAYQTNITVRKVDTPVTITADICQIMLNALQEKDRIQFRFNKFAIDPASFELLDNLALTANRCPDANISVEGHTDYFGAKAYNQHLSENRANSVAQYLIEHGVAKSRIRSAGYGETRPLVLDGTPEGNAKNRRIEFRVLNQ